MKILNFEITNMSRLVFPLALMLLMGSCSNVDKSTFTDIEEEDAIVFSDSWICDMESFEEDYWSYEIYLESNGDYIAVSKTRILKVSKDGILNSMIMLNYPDDDDFVFRIYNNKIYRFHYDNDFQNYDPTAPIELQIYDFDFNLLSDHVLASNGLFYDVEIESDNLFGMLVYTPDDYTMTLKKLDLNDGLIAETVLNTSGTNPTNLHILETGEYLCTASSSQRNLRLLDNDLNLLWLNNNNTYTISDAKYVAGQGIYITGTGTFLGSFDDLSYVALMDMNGDEVNFVTYDPGERWSPIMQVNEDRICLVQEEPETRKNMLFSILDFDLNTETTIEIPGGYSASNIVVNELESFSFVYGKPIDPTNPDNFPVSNTRIFKFDDSYTLPTNIIVQ